MISGRVIPRAPLERTRTIEAPAVRRSGPVHLEDVVGPLAAPAFRGAQWKRFGAVDAFVFETPEEQAWAAAWRIAQVAQDRARVGKSMGLGPPTGSSPRRTWGALTVLRDQGVFDPSSVWIAQLDGYYPLGRNDPRSYERELKEKVLGPLGIPERRALFIDTEVDRSQVEREIEQHERRIQLWGGVDIQGFGIGDDGHLGFNPVGSGMQAQSRLVRLSPQTIEANAIHCGGVDRVPREAITRGVLNTFKAKETLTLASGEAKASLVKRTLEGPMGPQWVASQLRGRSWGQNLVLLDQEAASGLSR